MTQKNTQVVNLQTWILERLLWIWPQMTVSNGKANCQQKRSVSRWIAGRSSRDVLNELHFIYYSNNNIALPHNWCDTLLLTWGVTGTRYVSAIFQFNPKIGKTIKTIWFYLYVGHRTETQKHRRTAVWWWAEGGGPNIRWQDDLGGGHTMQRADHVS